ncbi:hypothetical protein NEOLEDRAFT_1138877 [Neolentinus lepideus HHB14362 ss-1]|uniref:Uncharacterized protein n=1 Tax=Neolentinus lepideus HHB14362 ss-1 TaxID=1314782 RepID=A0A165Q3B9_9AGAM|nr:hypothetical protein NEOLEDRAFT_1138877 [Neolentinus lepideus HHB14362 ss-1]
MAVLSIIKTEGRVESKFQSMEIVEAAAHLANEATEHVQPARAAESLAVYDSMRVEDPWVESVMDTVLDAY